MITDIELKRVEGLSSRAAAEILGYSKTAINSARARRTQELAVTEAAWPVIDRGQKVAFPNVPQSPGAAAGDWEVAVILPDPQIGFRVVDGKLDPFHDDKAMNVALQIARYLDPDKVINIGDLLDFPAYGRYAQEPGFQTTTQAGIDKATEWLTLQRHMFPNAEIVLHEGNHEVRLQNYLLANAKAAVGIKRGQTVPEAWPVMSTPYLLRLDELNIKYIGGYPAGEYWINNAVRTIHGVKVASGSSTAARYGSALPHISTIFGHVHRLELQSTTTHDRLGAVQSLSVSAGCLCRIDGVVPSVGGAVDLQGTPVKSYENWAQGLCVVYYKPNSTEFYVDLVQIHDGHALYQGLEFVSS